MKKTLALLLCAMLVLALVPVVALPASAADATVVYVKDGGTGDGSTAENALGSIADAYNALDLSKDCTIVVCGPLTFPETTVSYGTEYTGSVTITSNYGGTDYDATITLSSGSTPRFRLWGTTVFENVTLKMAGNFYLIICQFHNFKIAETVTVIPGSGSQGATFGNSLDILAGYQVGEGDPLLKDDPDSKLEIYGGEKLLVCEYNRGSINPAFNYTGTHETIIGGNAKVGTYYNAAVNGAAVEVTYGDTILTLKDNAVIGKLASTEGGINTMKSFTFNWLGGTVNEITDLHRTLVNPIGDRTERTLYTEGTKLVYNDTTAAAANFADVSGKFDAAVKDGAASGTDTPAAPTKVEVPARPTLTNTTDSYHIAFGSTNGSNPKDGEDFKAAMAALQNGGTVYVTGKAFCSLTHNPLQNINSKGTILVTAKEGDTSYIELYPDVVETAIKGHIMGNQGISDANNDKTDYLEVYTDAIFENVVIYNRADAKSDSQKFAPGDPVIPFTILVKNGAKTVFADSVLFRTRTEKLPNGVLEIEEGAYAFLDVTGFSKYTGKGTIVVNNKLVDKVTKDDFAGFEGVICDEDGNVLFASAPAPVNPTPTPATGSMTVVIAAGAILASLGAVVALKKREER